MNSVLEGDIRSPRSLHSHNNDNIHLKVLVPCVAAGAIIGKAGEAIAVIQRDSGAKVKISKSYDFYPGTTERICLIMGTILAITQVHDYIMDKIHEKPEQMTRINSESKVVIERHKQVKILVPNSTAGMIIGKSGSYIKEIKEKSGAFVQISQKSKEINLPERCITIAGEIDQNRVAVSLILGKLDEDPHSGSCPSISYVDMLGPVASAYPTGSPYAMITNNFNCPQPSLLNSPHSASSSRAESISTHFTAVNPNVTPTTSATTANNKHSSYSRLSNEDIHYYHDENSDFAVYRPLSSMETVRNILRMSGFSQIAVHSISTAIETICQYRLTNCCTSAFTSTSSTSSSSSLTAVKGCHYSNVTLYDSFPLYGAHNNCEESNNSTTPLEFLINSYLKDCVPIKSELCQSSAAAAHVVLRRLKISREKMESLGGLQGQLLEDISLKTNTEIKFDSEDESSADQSFFTLHISGIDLNNVLEAIGLIIYTSSDKITPLPQI